MSLGQCASFALSHFFAQFFALFLHKHATTLFATGIAECGYSKLKCRGQDPVFVSLLRDELQLFL